MEGWPSSQLWLQELNSDVQNSVQKKGVDDDDDDGSDFFLFCGLYMKMQLQCFRSGDQFGGKWKSIYFSFNMHFLNKKKSQRGLFTQSCTLFYTPAFKRKRWTFARNFISFLFYNTKYQYFCVLGLCSLVHYLNVALFSPFYVSIWTFHFTITLNTVQL